MIAVTISFKDKVIVPLYQLIWMALTLTVKFNGVPVLDMRTWTCPQEDLGRSLPLVPDKATWDFPPEVKKTYVLKDNDFCKSMWDEHPSWAQPPCNKSVLPSVTFFEGDNTQDLCTVDLKMGIANELNSCTPLMKILTEAWTKDKLDGIVYKLINWAYSKLRRIEPL